MSTTLIVTEKPDAAVHVAEALSKQAKPKKIIVGGVPFFEIADEKGEKIIVCSALGHLYAVDAINGRRSQYPVWDLTWKPIHLVQRRTTKQAIWIESISKVAKKADRFINACDYDVEGSLIGYMVLKFACNGAEQKAQRMRFSTLTPKELREAYVEITPELDYSHAFAGMCRHEVDWLYGINLSRALTQSAYRAARQYTTISTGRVQGPTMKFVVDREREIQTFVPTPFWILKVTFDLNGKKLEADFENGRLATKSEAERIIRECAGKTGFISKVESRVYQDPPPPPFDLSTLQSETYRHFKLTPRVALGLAERLYLDQSISYPRTSSQKLPSSIGYEEVMNALGRMKPYSKEVASLLAAGTLHPHEGDKHDPAHPAVYPTGITPKAPPDSSAWKVYDLIVRRFLATFGQPATKETSRVTMKVGNYSFFIHGSRLLQSGWLYFYGPYARFDELTLPSVSEGQKVLIDSIVLQEKTTQPPPRYNPSSLLKAMEEAEIGTKATRAEIIDTLYRRGYVQGQRMAATSLAFAVSEILTTYCPKIVDADFTHELETMMEKIEQGKETREHIVSETIASLKPIFASIKEKEDEIGSELSLIVRDSKFSSVTLSVLCPKCGLSLRVVKNPKSKKRFIGCSGKFKSGCSFALPLPQYGTLKLLDKRCSECNFQMVQVRYKARKPLISCPNCFARNYVKDKP